MKDKLKLIPFFLLTIPAFFLLYNNNYYFGLLEWSFISIDMLIYILTPFMLLPLLRYAFRSWIRAGILVAVLMMLFYFFQPLQDFLKSLPYISFLAKYKVLISLLAISLVALIVFLRENRKSVTNIFTYINVLFILLVAYEMITGFFNAASGKINSHDLADKEKNLSKSFQPCDTCLRPDIYFFIFDEYTSPKVLASEFNYLLDPLYNDLLTKGFYLSDDSRSNYNFTHMSIGSEMNLMYLPSVKQGKYYYARDFLQADYTIYKNELCLLLAKQGYRLQNYSIFNIEQLPAYSVRPFREEFLSFIFNQTLPNKLYQDIGWNFRLPTKSSVSLSAGQKNQVAKDHLRFKQTREGILKTAANPGAAPVFTYAHFLLPHRPYYFDSTGKRLPEDFSYYSSDNKNDYLQQLVYTNRFVIQPLIDSIFTLSRRPFIIILQGDHGYRSHPEGKESLEFNKLNAIYFPDRDYSSLYNDFSSVNTFRLVFNKYFAAGFPLLKDSTVFLSGNMEK